MDVITRFMDKVSPEPNSGCWLWTGLERGAGYGSFNYLGRERRAHRIAWALLRGPIPVGMSVLHRCDVRLCVNPAHLFLGTQQDNIRDSIAKGRFNTGPCSSPGERNSKARLTEGAVRFIRASALSRAALARLFGVAPSTVRYALRGTTWAHVRLEANTKLESPS